MNETYQIADWAEVYENNRTRELKRLDWVPMPNRMDGDGYTELVDHPDGGSHLGAWTAIVRIASRCEPRGTLVREGGKAHDPHSLARISRLPAGLFAEAIPRFLQIGWLVCISNDSGNLQDDATKPHQGATIPQDVAVSSHLARARSERNGMERTEGKEGKEGKETTTTNAISIVRNSELPKTLAAARRRFPSTDAKMARDIAASVRKAVTDATDEEIAEGIASCSGMAKKSAAFFIGTVPGAVASIRARARDAPDPEADQRAAFERARELWRNAQTPEQRAEVEAVWPALRPGGSHEKHAS